MSENNEVTREEIAIVISRYDNFYRWIQHLDPTLVVDSLLDSFIITRKPEPLPSEPDSLWLDNNDDVWRVNSLGVLRPVGSYHPYTVPDVYAPFRRLVVAE